MRRYVPEGVSGDVGWCHNCGTLQLFFDCPVLAVPWAGGARMACCVVCGTDEPAHYAVFPMPDSMRVCAEERHQSWAPIPCEVCGRGGSSRG